jgi:hypothetical protein
MRLFEKFVNCFKAHLAAFFTNPQKTFSAKHVEVDGAEVQGGA